MHAKQSIGTFMLPLVICVFVFMSACADTTDTFTEPDYEQIAIDLEDAPGIVSLDLSESSDGLEVLALYPELEELNLSGRGFESFDMLLSCPGLKYLNLSGNNVSLEQYLSLCEELPECDIIWDIPLCGERYPQNTEEIDLSGYTGTFSDLSVIVYFQQLKHIDLRGWELSIDEMDSVSAMQPDAEIIYSFTFFGIDADGYSEELCVNKSCEINITLLSRYLKYMPELNTLDLCACTVDSSGLEPLLEQYPQINFIWTIHLAKWSIRTDAIAFSTFSGSGGYQLDSDDLYALKYCTQLKALDLGHHAITELKWLEPLSELRVLILADNQITDVTEIGKLTHLRYLELFGNQYLSDISPLANLTELQDLNLSCCYRLNDISPLYGLTSLERLWLNYLSIPSGQLKTFSGNVPECEICHQNIDPTDGGWRKHARYTAVRNCFNNNCLDDAFR